jgi:hypothetical protein
MTYVIVGAGTSLLCKEHGILNKKMIADCEVFPVAIH